jgi:hypothetical protein
MEVDHAASYEPPWSRVKSVARDQWKAALTRSAWQAPIVNCCKKTYDWNSPGRRRQDGPTVAMSIWTISVCG